MSPRIPPNISSVQRPTLYYPLAGLLEDLDIAIIGVG
jgi:hypothetical protein